LQRWGTTLETLKRTSIAKTDSGLVVFCKPNPNDPKYADWNPGFWGFQAVHPPGVWVQAMNYMYRGQRRFGLDLARRPIEQIMKRGWLWDQPNIINSARGPRMGCDYRQNMMIWALPAAIEGQDLAGPCQSGGLVDRILKAAK